MSAKPSFGHLLRALIVIAVFGGLSVLSLMQLGREDLDTSDLARPVHPWPQELDVFEQETSWRVAAYLSDRVWGRHRIRRTEGRLSMLLGDTALDGVVEGRQGWLFLQRTVEPPPRRRLQWTARRPVRAVASIGQRMLATGREFRMMIAPNKATVYPELLPNRLRTAAQSADGRLHRVRRLLRDQSTPGFIDLQPMMKRAAQQAKSRGTDALYHDRDTHWNSLGASIAARALIESLGGQWDESALIRIESQPFHADLLRMLGEDFELEVPWWKVVRDGVETITVDSDLYWARYETTSSGPRLLPSLAVIADSYSLALREVLPQYFESVTLLWFGMEPTPEQREYLADARIVTILAIERDFVTWNAGQQTEHWGSNEPLFQALETQPLLHGN